MRVPPLSLAWVPVSQECGGGGRGPPCGVPLLQGLRKPPRAGGAAPGLSTVALSRDIFGYGLEYPGVSTCPCTWGFWWNGGVLDWVRQACSRHGKAGHVPNQSLGRIGGTAIPMVRTHLGWKWPNGASRQSTREHELLGAVRDGTEWVDAIWRPRFVPLSC